MSHIPPPLHNNNNRNQRQAAEQVASVSLFLAQLVSGAPAIELADK